MDEWAITPPAILNVVVVLASFGIIANIVIQPVRATVSFLNKGIPKMKEQNSCGCGRSPTGKCVGWHALSEEKYHERKTAYLAKQAEKK
mgnify:FL=1